VALRASHGRFLRADEQGAVRADRLFPAHTETFELIELEGDQVALRAHNGRFLYAAGPDARRLRADGPRLKPGDRETFVRCDVGGQRAALKARNHPHFIRLHGHGPKPTADREPGRPGPDETVEIYRLVQIPDQLRGTLASIVQKLLAAELAGKQYDKVESRAKKKYIELPAPTLRDPRRKKKHRVLSYTEQYHVKARLDGPLEIRIPRMACLKACDQRDTGVLMFAVEAGVPVRGKVAYVIPKRVSASTGYRATVRLAMVGEVRCRRSEDSVSFSSPELLELRVEVQLRDLSNDLLNVVRGGAEGIINRQLAKNNNRIRQRANQAIRRAVKAHSFSHPLLKYLELP